MSRRLPKHPSPQFRVRDLVRMKRGWEGIVFEIIEDQGNIGRGGRRFYTIKMKADDEPTVAFPEEELEALPESASAPKHP